MSIIAVGSLNHVKAHAIQVAFERMFASKPMIEMVASPSGVSDQPQSDDETLRGAINRANGARAQLPEADIWAGIEGGIEDDGINMNAFAWIVLLSKTTEGRSRSATFPIPAPIANLVRNGMELGKADDIVFGRENSKQNEGAVGLLTDGVVDRIALYQHAATMALIPFKNPELFNAENESVKNSL